MGSAGVLNPNTEGWDRGLIWAYHDSLTGLVQESEPALEPEFCFCMEIGLVA